jgi:hypothetical protein
MGEKYQESKLDVKKVNESVYYYYNNKLRWKTATCDTFGKQKKLTEFCNLCKTKNNLL